MCTLRTHSLDQFLFPFPSPTIIWRGMSGILSHIPPQTLLLPLGEEGGRKSPLTSSSLAPKVGGRTLIGAPPFCFAGGGGGMCEGRVEKEGGGGRKFVYGSQPKKFSLPPPSVSARTTSLIKST